MFTCLHSFDCFIVCTLRREKITDQRLITDLRYKWEISCNIYLAEQVSVGLWELYWRKDLAYFWACIEIRKGSTA